MPSSSLSRRRFLQTATLAPAVVAFPHVLRSQQGRSPNSRLHVACIGVGGRGRAAVEGTRGENHVAYVDVDDARAAKTYSESPDVPRFRDYRVMLDKLGSTVDAVTISTPDHMHFPIAMAALQRGKHVFVEKPLGHTVWEAVNPVSMTQRALIFGGTVAWGAVAAVFLFDLLIAPRGWCGHVCPVGAILHKRKGFEPKAY